MIILSTLKPSWKPSMEVKRLKNLSLRSFSNRKWIKSKLHDATLRVNHIVVKAHRSVVLGEESIATFGLQNLFGPRWKCNVYIYSC